MFAGVSVRDGLVTRVSVSTQQAGLRAISINQMLELPSDCGPSPCVRHLKPRNKAFAGINIVISNESGIRNHIPEAVNSECLSRLHGCNTYAELMPITKELNLEAAGR
jgi:hypothetical protein